MKLNVIKTEGARAILYIDGNPGRLVTVRCHDATATARRIAQCVNLFDSMRLVLEMFSSQQMGRMLVDAVLSMNPDDPRHAEVERRMRSLINAVDVTLKGIELTTSRGNPE